MNLPKAIEKLEKGLPADQWMLTPDLRDAVQLGIEALKRIKEVREGKAWVGIDLLLGETED